MLQINIDKGLHLREDNKSSCIFFQTNNLIIKYHLSKPDRYYSEV